MAKKTKDSFDKGQVLLFVFMLLLFLSLVVGNLAVMWHTGLESYPYERDFMVAFFAAEAGMQRGIEELSLLNANASVNLNTWENTDGYNDTMGEGNYSVIIEKVSNTKKITSTGRCRNSQVKIAIALPKHGAGGPPYGNAWGYWRRFQNSWHYE